MSLSTAAVFSNHHGAAQSYMDGVLLDRRRIQGGSERGLVPANSSQVPDLLDDALGRQRWNSGLPLARSASRRGPP